MSFWGQQNNFFCVLKSVKVSLKPDPFIFQNMKITSSKNLSFFIIFRWGAPAWLLSDQGREFVAKVNEVCREFVLASNDQWPVPITLKQMAWTKEQTKHWSNVYLNL
jgi:hypothetical protein